MVILLTLLLLIRLGVTGLKKFGSVYLLGLFGGTGEEGWYELVFVERCMVSMALVLWGIKKENYVAMLQGSEISAELHSRNLI